MCILTLVVVYTISVGGLLYAQDDGPLVSSVTIRGQKRIELQAIEGRLTLKAKDRFTADALRDQVKILYGTGYFEDVQVETEQGSGGVAVTFVVREKPFITEIVFDGNEELSDSRKCIRTRRNPLRFGRTWNGWWNCRGIKSQRTTST